MAGIQYAGEYILKEASLVTSSGVTIDLAGTIIGMDIYENIFSTSLSGSFVMIDENNIVTNGPIVGQEYLYLKISTPSLEEFDIDFNDSMTKRIREKIIDIQHENIEDPFGWVIPLS